MEGSEKISIKRKSYYKVRQGTFRVIYAIDDKEKIVRVLKIKYRKDAYKGELH